MSNVIEIGWALPPRVQQYYFHEYRRRETLKSLYPYESDIPEFYYCPPVSEYYKNCFGYYSVSDINVLIRNGNLHFLEGHKQSILEVDGGIDVGSVFKIGSNSLEYIMPDEVFVSDTPGVTLEIIPHPRAKYKNLIYSELDIFKWFRSIHPPYYFNDKMFHFQIGTGEPLCMIRFNTPNNKPIKLVELDYEKISKYSNPRETVMNMNGNKSLNIRQWLKYFDIFSEKRPKKLIDYARIDK